MTTGEKIQFCRKQLGMSQEELGQKLMVSRQTISLWEKGQTAPTIDNLLRLKEIFGITVDELLGCESTPKENTPVPSEKYTFRYDEAELTKITRTQKWIWLKKPVLFGVVWIVCLILLILSESNRGFIGFCIGALFVGILFYVKGIRNFNRNFKKSKSRVLSRTYQYMVFEDYFTITVTKDGEVVRTSKYLVQDIDSITDTGQHYLLTIGGQSFILRKHQLSENSVFCNYVRGKKEVSEVKGAWKALSIVLFVASIASILGAMILVVLMMNENNLPIENMWVFYLFTPVPVASIVWGYVMKAKGYKKYRKNIIIGIIVAVILCLYGSFSFVFSGLYDHSDEVIVSVEQTVGIEIPEHKSINTQDLTKGGQSKSNGYVYYISDVYFEEASVKEFEKRIRSDEKWLSAMPSELVGVTSDFSHYRVYDFYLLYNTDTCEYNLLPETDGTYNYISVFYNVESNMMEIVNYDLEYVK